MKQLVARRTKVLDATLMRTQLQSASLDAAMEAMTLSIVDAQKHGNFSFHPLMRSYTEENIGNQIYCPDDVRRHPLRAYRGSLPWQRRTPALAQEGQ